MKLILTTLSFFFLSITTYAQWTQVGQSIYGDTLSDHLGRSISLSEDGSVMAISASDSNGEGVDNCGQVRVFRYVAGEWQQIGQDLNGIHVNDYFGSSVSLNSDGTILAVGAVGNDNNGNGSGQVRIFENISDTWTLIGEINGEAENDLFGGSVSLSADGTILAAGAKENDGNGTSAGHVRVYQHTSSWTQIGSDIDGDASYNYFGYSVSLSDNGTILAVGAYGNGNGKVKIFENDGSNWVQIGSDIMGDSSGDYFGYSVSINAEGSVFAASAFKNDANGSDAGQVKIFENIAGVWQQKGNSILGQSENDYFGYSISLSTDGLTVAAGAYKNDDAGNDAGRVKVLGYSSTDNEWVQIEDSILGLSDYNSFGKSVCLGNNGQIVAVGATGVNGGTGRIRVFASSCGDVGSLDIGNDTIVCNGQYIDLIGNVAGQYLWSTSATSSNISVADSGYFYVTVTQDICYVYDSVHIADMTPNVELFGDTLTCPYDTIIIDAGIGYSYLWNMGEETQSIQTNTEGLYSVTITNSYNCTDVDSVYLSHSINETGVEDTIEICVNGAITISANPINNNTWNSIQNTDTINYLFVNDTTFFLEAIDTMLCVINDTVFLKVDSNFVVPTGIDDTIFTCYNNELTLFCNPENENIWNSVLHSDSITYLAVNDTIFYLDVISPIGCQYTDTIFIDQDSSLNFIFANTYISADTIMLGDTLWLYGTESGNSELLTFTKNPGIFLPDGVGLDFIDTMFINSSGIIDNLDQIQNITLNMEHSYAGDLSIEIICPNGQTMEILTYPTGLGNHFLGEPVDDDMSNTLGVGYDYIFKPEATLTFQDVADQNMYTYTDNDGTEYTNQRYIPEGEYVPNGDFNNLIGCPVNGEWEIVIEDHMSSDNGVIFSWNISLYASSITEWEGENIDDINNDTTYAVPTTTGWHDYTYFVQNEYGCLFDTTISVYVDGNVKVDEIDAKPKTGVIYPNPAHNFVILQSELWQSQTGLVEFYDLTGKKIKSVAFDKTKKELKIQIDDLLKGIYLVKIGSITRKLMVE